MQQADIFGYAGDFPHSPETTEFVTDVRKKLEALRPLRQEIERRRAAAGDLIESSVRSVEGLEVKKTIYGLEVQLGEAELKLWQSVVLQLPAMIRADQSAALTKEHERLKDAKQIIAGKLVQIGFVGERLIEDAVNNHPRIRELKHRVDSLSGGHQLADMNASREDRMHRYEQELQQMKYQFQVFSQMPPTDQPPRMIDGPAEIRAHDERTQRRKSQYENFQKCGAA